MVKKPSFKNSIFCLQKFLILENDECDLMKRSICTDPDIDEYSIKATRTLYIGNLLSEISYNELREAYSAYGDIIVCIDYLIKENCFNICLK
jgi:RNA recognition motif-containing protein